ncbi:hypothetical protein NDN08_001653 [Rhodosorus marinus]|uniref:Ribosomal RNA large subunit methyltransferase H n=1 Tax=Rhodosorus marinus TaxID=101924 RepID=A0AAV8UU78_9RHOD|nr:hypothetical protein NDN08_001653 [Rhodosorus marinus]
MLTGFVLLSPSFGRTCGGRIRRRLAWTASLRVRLVSVGRRTAKEAWAETPVEEYQKRLGPNLDLECEYVKDDAALVKAMKSATETHWKIAMDAEGRSYDSQGFSDLLMKRLETSGGRVHIFIGGAEGLSAAAKSSVNELVSLSKMTFTHKIARLVLVEQIYRAIEIHKGTKYNK